MEQVNIQAIGTFINDNYHHIINDLNLNDITPRFDLSNAVINNICKYPIKVSKVVSFSIYYDYDHDTQPIEPKIPVVDINCTPIKSISIINPYSSESMTNINIHGYQVIDNSFENHYQIMIRTFNNVIKGFNFDTVFYVDFVNFERVNKIGFYVDTEYHVSSVVKEYYQKAFDYLKKECKVYFDTNKSYLFLDTNHNEIIIYNNNIIYRFNNLDVEKMDPLLQRYVPSAINCFEEFIINELPIKSPVIELKKIERDESIDDEPEEITDSENISESEEEDEEDYDY